jgi:transcriptional regulator with XRE-family HTH domain
MNKGEWLDNLLEERGLKPADLARKSGLDPAVISNIRNGKRNTGVDVANKIADALNLPYDVVYRAAGILPPGSDGDDLDQKILKELEDLPADEKQGVIDYIRFVIKRHKKK